MGGWVNYLGVVVKGHRQVVGNEVLGRDPEIHGVPVFELLTVGGWVVERAVHIQLDGGGRGGGSNELLWVGSGWVGGEIGGLFGGGTRRSMGYQYSNSLLWVSGWVGGWVVECCIDRGEGGGGRGGSNELLWVVGGWVGGLFYRRVSSASFGMSLEAGKGPWRKM